jgi:integrase
MPKAKITKRLVDSLEPGHAEYVMWDSELRRYGVKITPAGRKVHIVKYRFHGRQRKLTIGLADVITPEQARAAARDLLSQVANNHDPAAARNILVGEPTIEQAFGRFIAEHAEARRKPRTATEYRQLFQRCVNAKLGKRKLSDVSTMDIANLHTSLRSTPYQANRTVALLSKFFNWCESPTIALRAKRTNPCHEIERFGERSRERFLSTVELGALGQALKAAETSEWPWAIAAIRLLIFTGARRNEILQLRWQYVDLERRRLSLPISKTGAKVIVLSMPAVEILRHLETLRKAFPESPWVIPSPRDANRPFVQLQSVWERVRAAAKLADLRLHDLRHTFASIAAARGTQQHLIMAMLGHANPVTTGRYMHYADDPLRSASDEVAAHIVTAMQAEAAKIEPIKP